MGGKLLIIWGSLEEERTLGVIYCDSALYLFTEITL